MKRNSMVAVFIVLPAILVSAALLGITPAVTGQEPTTDTLSQEKIFKLLDKSGTDILESMADDKMNEDRILIENPDALDKVGTPALEDGTPENPEPGTAEEVIPPVVETVPAAEPVRGEPVSMEDDPNPLYLALVWNHHQPRYFKDAETGEYEEGWVRIHSANAYLPMVKLVQDYPQVKCTFNITPSLMLQMKDIISMYKAGKHTDRRMRSTMKDATTLDNDDRFYLLVRYFDMPRPTMLDTSAPYRALLDKRDGLGPEESIHQFSADELRDLQVWFDLTWSHPMFRTGEGSLAELWDKGLSDEHFSEEDKKILFDAQISLLESVLPTYRKAQETGQIEVITTPYAHPILPLVYNTELAAVALPGEPLPTPAFSRPDDARRHVNMAKKLYAELFGRNPKGMWPGEGSVGQDIIPLVGGEGFKWLLSDVKVLQRSLGRKSLTIEHKYLPYTVKEGEHQLYMLFRDTELSDKIGFLYPKMETSDAVADFIGKLKDIHDKIPAGAPHIVTVVLDGENAWEHYPGRAEAFHRELYRNFTLEQKWLKTVRISDYLTSLPEDFTVPAIENLWPGSWIDADFHIWIGEEEENKGWDMLRQVRDYWQSVLDSGGLSKDAEEAVWNEMLAAEGSDWFWWFGSDQESTNDSDFDRQFRNTLKNVYTLTGQEAPDFLDKPIVPPSTVVPTEVPRCYVTPTVEGMIDPPDEWSKGVQLKPGAAAQTMASGGTLKKAAVAYDRDNFYLMAELKLAEDQGDGLNPVYQEGMFRVFIYPEIAGGFTDDHMTLVEIPVAKRGSFIVQSMPFGVPEKEYVKIQRMLMDVVEISLPWSIIRATSYSQVGVVVQWEGANQQMEFLPGPDATSHYTFPVSLLSDAEVVFSVDDPRGDDKGPGTYVYPKEGVFESGVFDLSGFDVLRTVDTNLFRFRFPGQINNPWSGPAGFSLQTFDVYIYENGNTNNPVLDALEGRNFEVDGGWHTALTADGWRSAMAKALSGSKVEYQSGVKALVDPFQTSVVLEVPSSIMGALDAGTRILPAVLSHDGNAPGRVRPIGGKATEWEPGGAQKDKAPAVFDVVLPPRAQQRKVLTGEDGYVTVPGLEIK